MKTANEISMDYNRAMQMTNELIELAARFRQATQQDAVNQLNSLNANWKGENAEHFVSKAAKYFRSTADVADQLESIAKGIKANAQSVYNAEMTALRIAQTRNYR